MPAGPQAAEGPGLGVKMKTATRERRAGEADAREGNWSGRTPPPKKKEYRQYHWA